MGHDDPIRRNLPLLALLLGTAAVYSQALGHPFLHFDDDLYVTRNPAVRAGLTLRGLAWAFTATDVANWHPVTWISHMLDVELFGSDPAGHHLVGILLHVANVALLYRFLLRATGAVGRSLAVAALFALHPLRVESVAWVAERKDVLSAFFMLLALLAWLSWVGKRDRRSYAAAVACHALGLMSKPMLVTFPFALLLLDLWPFGRDRRERPAALLLEKAPFFLLSAAACGVALFAQDASGAIASFEDLPPAARIANAIVSYAAYLGKTAWPASLAVFYPFVEYAPGDPRVVASACILAAITLFALLRFPRSRYPAIGWFWFTGTLVPVIGLVQAGDQGMADRYTYIPHVGLIVAACWGAADAAVRMKVPVKAQAAAAACVAIVLGCLTWQQLSHWRSDLALFAHAVEATTENHVARNNLGLSLVLEGRREEAIVQFREAVRIRSWYPDAHFNLGAALLELGRPAEAVPEFREALRLSPGEPDAAAWLERALRASGG